MSDVERIERWVRPEIRALAAYHVPDPSGMIKLDAMENPYTWPDELRRTWLELLQGVDVNRYPDPDARLLKGRLRDYLGISKGTEILLGNGSDELIQMVLMALAAPGRVVLSVDPGFVMYRMIAAFTGMRYVGVELQAEDFRLDLDGVLRAIRQQRPAVVFLAYPNNPTGNLFPAHEIREVIEAAPGLVVVDEAYAPFTDATFVDELPRYPHLLVMRTLSKMGLAGLRLGLLVGAGSWLREIDKTRLPYNINVLTQVSAELALRHGEVFAAQTAAIREHRDALYRALQGTEGIVAFPSEANFVLCRMPRGRAPEIHAALRRGGVLVKNLHASHPLLADCLRVTVGRPDENAAFLARLEAVLGR